MANLIGTDTPADVRGSTHGDFRELSKIAQGIKYNMKRSSNWDDLTHNKKEALELIATKLARILTGNAFHDDHWDDIKGYAELGKLK